MLKQMNQTKLIAELNLKKQKFIYAKIKHAICKLFPLQIASDAVLMMGGVGEFANIYRYYEYGKTWALTKEELE